MKPSVRLLISLLLAALLLTVCPLTAAAAPSATIAFSSSTLSPGDTLTVTVTFSADTVGAVDASMSYDSGVLQFVSGDGVSGGGGVLKLALYASSEGSSLRTSLTFRALAAGSCPIRITSSAVYTWDEALAGNPTAGATVVVADPSLSQNADLKSLTLSNGSLSPAFSAAVTAYTVTVPNSVASLTISAVAADSGASVRVSGSASLPVGVSQRVITVTAPGGATKTYTLSITRQAAVSTTASTAPSAGETTATASPAQEPCTLTYEGALYTVADDLTDIPLPAGYAVTTALCGERTVAAAQSANGAILLLWLTPAETEAETTAETGTGTTAVQTEPTAAETETAADTDTPVRGSFFVYRPETDWLFPYTPLSAASGDFLLCPVSLLETDGALDALTAAVWNLEGQSVPVWTFPEAEWSEFCVLCAVNPDGEAGLYRYDTREKTVQRYIPAAAPTTQPAAVTAAPPAGADGDGQTGGWYNQTLWGVSVGWYAAGGLLLVCIALLILTLRFGRQKSAVTAPRHFHEEE